MAWTLVLLSLVLGLVVCFLVARIVHAAADLERWALEEESDEPLVPPVVLINAYVKNTTCLETAAALSAQGLAARDVLVVIGGCEQEQDTVAAHSTHVEIRVTQNSFDYTALIALLEHRGAIEALRGAPLRGVFLMHDTCRVGPLFLRRLARRFRAKTTRLVTTAWEPFILSMNMGTYSLEDLEAQAEHILAVKTFPKTEGDRARAKIIGGFYYEDMVFKRLGVERCHNIFCGWHPLDRTVDATSENAQGQLHCRLHFRGLDLHKFQGFSPHHPRGWLTCGKTLLTALT